VKYRKLVFAGTMGSGKTTAIRALSDIPPVSTEVANQDPAAHAKSHTTVALDYGEVNFGEGDKLRLYGTPGQDRFSFMWPVIARGAMGVILLVDHSRPDPVADMLRYMEQFREHAATTQFVVGVGRIAEERAADLENYVECLAARGWVCPVLSVDVRRKDDVLLLVDVLLSLIETVQ
jgi:signal recognition particle receptor subunit beta